jgi:hypothetical protein
MNKIIISGLFIFLLMASACTVKRQAFSHVEVIKDSIHQSIDTSFHSGEVTIEIEQENSSGNKSLEFSAETFNRLIDSLFADIDTTCDKERVLQTITKTGGLWNCDTSFLETSLANSYAVVENGRLSHFLHQKDTTLKRRYDSLLKVITREREVWHSKQVVESSEKTTRSGFNFKLIGIIIVVLLLAWIIIKRLI